MRIKSCFDFDAIKGWIKYKSEFIEIYRKLLGGIFQSDKPLNARTLETTDKGDYIRKKVTYENNCGESIPAYMLVPKELKKPSPAVLCFHQHNGQFDIGKSEVVGRIGNPEQSYALDLVKRGYITFAADTKGFEERWNEGQGDSYIAYKAFLEGGSSFGLMVNDIKRAVDYLYTHSEVDKERIGCIGHSMGGMQTWLTLPLENRIKVGICSCATTTYRDLLGSGHFDFFCGIVPGLLKYGDIYNVMAMIAPRPYLILVGKSDPIFTDKGAKEVYRNVRHIYSLCGEESKVKLFVQECGHQFNEEMHKEAYGWLNRHL